MKPDLPLNTMGIKKVLLFPNRTRDEAFQVTKKTIRYLLTKDVEIFLPEEDLKALEGFAVLHNDNEIDFDQLDFAFVLGGDGTMVNCVHYLKGVDIPIIGINLGHLGYMTEIDPKELENGLEALFMGEFRIERRMMLEAQVADPAAKEDKHFFAVNEFVIHRDLMDSPMKIEAGIGKEHLGDFAADGVIISSPCGSTAYNFSAGGPILSPVADNMILTPLCSHSMLDRSLVLRGDDVLSFHIPSFVRGDHGLFNADAKEFCSFGPGTTIYVRKSEFAFCLAKIGPNSFYEIMQKKMRP